METKIFAKINDVNILFTENSGEKLIPIKPICEALGIDWKNQYDKIKDDEFLNSTVVFCTTVASDGKERDMFSLPVKYVFGWLFTINPKNVKPEAQESVKRYKQVCYEVLYDYFFGKKEKWDQSMKRTLQLQGDIRQLSVKPGKTAEDFDDYLDKSNELKKEKAIRRRLNKENISGMKSLFEI